MIGGGEPMGLRDGAWNECLCDCVTYNTASLMGFSGQCVVERETEMERALEPSPTLVYATSPFLGGHVLVGGPACVCRCRAGLPCPSGYLVLSHTVTHVPARQGRLCPCHLV